MQVSSWKDMIPNESFNNVVWSSIPKHVFIGVDTLKTGVWDGVVTYKSDYLGVKELHDLPGMDVQVVLLA